jgi:hypothetical protein
MPLDGKGEGLLPRARSSLVVGYLWLLLRDLHDDLQQTISTIVAQAEPDRLAIDHQLERSRAVDRFELVDYEPLDQAQAPASVVCSVAGCGIKNRDEGTTLPVL